MAERRKRSGSILSIYFHDNHDPSWMHADNWALDYWVRKSCCVTTDLVRTFRSSVLFFFFLKEERKIYRFIQSIKLKSKIFLKYLDSFLYWLSSILLIVINIWIHEILFIFSSSQLEILQDLKRTFHFSVLFWKRRGKSTDLQGNIFNRQNEIENFLKYLNSFLYWLLSKSFNYYSINSNKYLWIIQHRNSWKFSSFFPFSIKILQLK